MANATKKTQKDFFNEIIALATENGRDDLVEFAQGRIAILEKKRGSGKPTAKQEENEGIKAEIVAFLADNGGVTVSDMIKTEKFADYSSQKMSALLKQLVDTGKVAKTIDKKRAFFSLAEEVVEE